MALIATQLPEDFAAKIAKNAGVILSAFDTETWSVSRANIIGATSGGINFVDAPEYQDFGEDIDNCPKNTMELKQIQDREITISGTFVSADEAAYKRIIAAADLSGHVITPRDELQASDFTDLWFVFDYGDGNAVAIELKNVLSTGGLSIQTTDKAKGTCAFTFTAHYSIEDPSKVPYGVTFKA